MASETLVPHVSQRRIVETVRHVHDRKFSNYDFILIFNDGSAQRLRETPSFHGLRGYDIGQRSEHFILFKAKPNDDRSDNPKF